MSLSQFVYSLAGVEDQIPHSQLPSASDTTGNSPDQKEQPNDTTSRKQNMFSDLPGPTSTESVGAEDTPFSSDWFGFGSVAPSLPNPDPPIAPSSSPETPTSFLGYFFGGQTESPEIEKSSTVTNNKPSIGAAVTGGEVSSSKVTASEVQEEPDSDQAGIGSFLWTLVAGEEEVEGPTETAPIANADQSPLQQVAPPKEELPRTVVPQPLYRARKTQEGPGGGFTDSDAEQLVERIELGGPAESGGSQSGKTSRKSIMSDMEIKMKLKEAKVSLVKLREIQKETNDLLGIKTPSVIPPKPSISVSTTDQPDPSPGERNKPTVSKGYVTKKFVTRNLKTHVPYRAKIRFDALNAPISDRLKAYPPSVTGPLHAHQPMPVSLSGNFPRDVVVVSSVEARSHRLQY